MSRFIACTAAAALLAVLATPSGASSHGEQGAALEERLAALEARVATLEAERSFARLMPEFAERFHVMHIAGDSGDWAVAQHEFLEMKRLGAIARDIHPEHGDLLNEMMETSFEALEGAIGHGNRERFRAALEQATTTCNACHSATGNDFVQVVLDPPDALSLRHPHDLRDRKAPEGHTHGHGN